MNGDSTGLEPTNPSGAVDAEARDWTSERRLATLRLAEETLYALAEYKAAREVGDAAVRLVALNAEARAARERQRRSESLYGEDSPEAAQIDLEHLLRSG